MSVLQTMSNGPHRPNPSRPQADVSRTISSRIAAAPTAVFSPFSTDNRLGRAERMAYNPSASSPLETYNTTPALPQDLLCKQLKTIVQSQKFIVLIILAVTLSLLRTQWMKEELEHARCCPQSPSCPKDDFPIALLSALFVLLATGYFYILSTQALCADHLTCTRRHSAQSNHTASLLVLIAAIIRIIDLLFVRLSES